MLPPPTTMATSTPSDRTSRTSSAIASMRSGSCPYSSEPIRSSPEIFSRTRPKSGGASSRACVRVTAAPASLRPALEAGEALDLDVLLGLHGEVGPHLLDRLVAV